MEMGDTCFRRRVLDGAHRRGTRREGLVAGVERADRRALERCLERRARAPRRIEPHHGRRVEAARALDLDAYRAPLPALRGPGSRRAANGDSSGSRRVFATFRAGARWTVPISASCSPGCVPRAHPQPHAAAARRARVEPAAAPQRGPGVARPISWPLTSIDTCGALPACARVQSESVSRVAGHLERRSAQQEIAPARQPARSRPGRRRRASQRRCRRRSPGPVSSVRPGAATSMPSPRDTTGSSPSEIGLPRIGVAGSAYSAQESPGAIVPSTTTRPPTRAPTRRVSRWCSARAQSVTSCADGGGVHDVETSVVLSRIAALLLRGATCTHIDASGALHRPAGEPRHRRGRAAAPGRAAGAAAAGSHRATTTQGPARAA